MATHTFGTLADPSLFVELPTVEVTTAAGATIRVSPRPDPAAAPAAPVVLKARNSATLAALPNIPVNANGYWAATTTDVASIDISADDGTTWIGPVFSREAVAVRRVNGVAPDPAGDVQLTLTTDGGGAAAPTVGTTAGTVAAGDDQRIVGALQKTNNLGDVPDVIAARGALGIPQLLNALAPKANPTLSGTVTFTTGAIVNGLTKAMVGLGAVDNTADASKPVSSLQRTAIDAKWDKPKGPYTSQAAALSAAQAANWPAGTIVQVTG